jgi:hypothetical protein
MHKNPHKLRLFVLSAMVCAFGACQPAWAQDELAKPAEPARVRFIGNGLIGLTFYKNKTCVSGKGIVASRTGKQLGSALGILFRKAQNISLGMPETPNVTNLAKWDVTLSKAFYREYAVNANQPLTIQSTFYYFSEARRGNQLVTTTADCNSSSFFTPQAGKNYEVTLNVEQGTCSMNVMEIDTSSAQVKLVPVQRRLATTCSADNQWTPDPDGDAQPDAPVRDAATGVEIGQQAGETKSAVDQRVDEMLAGRRALRGFTQGAVPQCPDCPKTYSADAPYKKIKLPQTDDNETNKWVQDIEADFNAYLRSAGSSFKIPSEVVAIPCKGVQEDFRKAADFLGIAERSAERQQEYRRYAKPGASYYFRDIRVWPVRAACLNGKLHGDVEFWAFANQISVADKYLAIRPSLTHLRYTAANGKPAGPIYSVTRSEGLELVAYDDPAEAETERKRRKIRLEGMNYKVVYADPSENPRRVVVDNSIFEDKGSSREPTTTISVPLSAGRAESLGYDGLRKSSHFLLKGGVLHGETLFFGAPKSAGAAIPVTKICFKDGEKVTLDPCSVD